MYLGFNCVSVPTKNCLKDINGREPIAMCKLTNYLYSLPEM